MTPLGIDIAERARLVLRDAEAKLKNASTGEEKAKMLALLGDTRVAYREAQRAYFETLSTGNDPLWLIVPCGQGTIPSG